MLKLYDNTRILPNESLCAEVNFRLVEDASCGCCLLTPDIGEDQDALLEPGKKCLIYANGLELLEQIDLPAARPEQAEAIGYAAWRRIQAEHLRQFECMIWALPNNSGIATIRAMSGKRRKSPKTCIASVCFGLKNTCAEGGREQAFLTMAYKTPAIMRALETAL